MKNKKPVVVFLIITMALSCICYFVRIRGGEAAAGMTSILMWCPAVAAFIVKGISFRGEKVLGWNTCHAKYALAAVGIPAVYLFFSYGVYWIINSMSFTGQIYTSSPLMLLLIAVSGLITATGEEIGWRGFLLPKLAEIWNVRIAVMVSGLIWAVWHFPLMVAGLYQSGTKIWYQLPMFTVEVLAITLILSYLRFRSGSVWPAIILHAAHNYFDQVICGPLTKADGKAYFVGETGFMTALLLVAVALFIAWKWKRETTKEAELQN